MAMSIRSTAFEEGGEIPQVHTCEEGHLALARVVGGTGGARSLALIVDDPDAPDPKAPKMTYVHWVLYGLPPDTRGSPRPSRRRRCRRRTRGRTTGSGPGTEAPVRRSAAIATSSSCTRSTRSSPTSRTPRRRSSRRRWKVTSSRRPAHGDVPEEEVSGAALADWPRTRAELEAAQISLRPCPPGALALGRRTVARRGVRGRREARGAPPASDELGFAAAALVELGGDTARARVRGGGRRPRRGLRERAAGAARGAPAREPVVALPDRPELLLVHAAGRDHRAAAGWP